MRVIFVILCVCVCVSGMHALPLLAAGNDPLQQYHLTNGEVARLMRQEDSHLYGTGSEMTNIYNGGVDTYLHAGVFQASQYYYKREKHSAEMVVLRLKSSKHAIAFYAKWKKDMGPKFTAVRFPKAKSPAYGVTYVMDGLTYGYACTKDYMVTVTLDTDDAKLASAMILASIAKMRT